MKISFSSQAMALIGNLKEFNDKDFMTWLETQGYPVGSKTILEYLYQRELESKGKPCAAREVVTNGS